MSDEDSHSGDGVRSVEESHNGDGVKSDENSHGGDGVKSDEESQVGDGVKSDDYRLWKAQTLAQQTSHKEAEQRTGLWQQFREVEVKKKVKNDFVVELAQGCR